MRRWLALLALWPALAHAAIAWALTGTPAEQSIGFGSATATFSNVSIGTAAADRNVIVGVAQDNGSNTVSGVTVGGFAAFQVIQESGHNASLWSLNVASGTTATIVVTVTGSAFNHVSIIVGAITGGDLAPSATGVFPFGYHADPYTVTATVPTDGLGVVFVMAAGTGFTASWTNAIGDAYTSTSQAAFMAHTTTSGSVTPSLTAGINYTGASLVMGTWAPSGGGAPAGPVHSGMTGFWGLLAVPRDDAQG